VLISRNFVPSLFTVLNGFCGFMSLINSMNGDFDQACLFIIYAMLFDGFDGIVARLLHSSSKFGVELDSLCDVISFGVAPSFLLYTIQLKNFETIGIIVASLFMVFSSLRLARFNVQLVGFDKDYFKGLPTPIAAVTICSYILFYHNKIFTTQTSTYAIWVIAILLPILMISRIKYDTLPKINKANLKRYPVKFIILFIAVVLIIITKAEGLFAFCLFYLSSGIIRGIYLMMKPKHRKAKEEKEEEKEAVEKIAH
jgi:CDP-diacylglycerol--serine O-phosphatidyltransferase